MAEFKPSGDDFEDAGYGANYLEWIGCVPSTTELLGASPIYGRGKIHDAYDVAPLFIGIGANDHAAFSNDVAGGHIKSFLQRRDDYPADCRVSAAFSLTLLAAGNQLAQRGAAIFGMGLLARATGGTLLGSGTEEVRLEDISGYALQFKPAVDPTTIASTNVRHLQVVRYNAGAATPLASNSLGLNFIKWTTSRWNTPILLEMRLTDSGPNTDIEVDISLLGAQPVVVTNAIQVQDTTPLQNAGRCGFLVTKEGTRTALSLTPTVAAHNYGTYVDACLYFQVSDSTGLALYREEWDRFTTTDGALQITDSIPTVGNSVQAALTHDQFGTAVRYAFVTDHLELTGTASDESILSLFHRTNTDPTRQHKSLDITIPTGTHTDLAIGIALRGTQTTTAPIASYLAHSTGTFAYIAYCVHTPAAGTPYQIQIDRVSNGTSITIAVLASASALFPVDGTQFNLDFECFPQDGPDPDGAAVMRVKIDTVQQVLVGTGVSGVSVTAVGKVTDASASRITSGTHEGFAFSSSGAGTQTVELDNWTEEALTSQEKPDDLPNVAYADEGTATETINDLLLPDYEFVVERLRGGEVKTPYSSGHMRANSGYVVTLNGTPTGVLAERRVFTFAKNVGDGEDMRRLSNLFDRLDGMTTPVNFLTDGETVKVVFSSESWTTTRVGPGAWRNEFQLIELF